MPTTPTTRRGIVAGAALLLAAPAAAAPAQAVEFFCTGQAVTSAVHSTDSMHSSDSAAGQVLPAATGVVTYATPPSAVRNLTIEAGDTTATVLWDPPTDLGGLPVQGYDLSVEPYGWRYQAGATATGTQACALTGLINATTYTVTVTARNAKGAGPAVTASFTPSRPQFPIGDPGPPPQPAPNKPADPRPAGPAKAHKKPTVHLSTARPTRANTLRVRWHAHHTPRVQLTWQRNAGKSHTRTTSPSGRITLAGPPGTRYTLTVAAGRATAQRTYRIR